MHVSTLKVHPVGLPREIALCIGCKPYVPRLQPYVPRLQPYVPRLQPYVPTLRFIQLVSHGRLPT